MRFRAERDCTDFNGRYFRRGEIVDLLPGWHSTWLKPLDPPGECSPEDVEEAAKAAGDTEADTAADVEACGKEAPKEKTVRKRAKKKVAAVPEGVKSGE